MSIPGKISANLSHFKILDKRLSSRLPWAFVVNDIIGLGFNKKVWCAFDQFLSMVAALVDGH